MRFFNKKGCVARFVSLFSCQPWRVVRKIFSVNSIAQEKEKCPVEKSFIGSMIVAGGIVLTGCQGIGPGDISSSSEAKKDLAQDAHSSSMTVNVAQAGMKTEGPVEQCQRELSALGKINTDMYEKRRVAFSGLLKNASVYSSLRQDINNQTKETVDALYKYKTQKLCHDIEQDLQQALISHGENLQ